MAFESFEELTANRRKWVEASRENGFENGIRRLLTDLYPDKAHFLYELLQNAEDAGATRVEFRLEDSALIFVHDGKRLFNLKDVESITSIADSTKRNDGGSIGKFGIGFKAVFSYTLTPIVYSGAWHFKICNTVVPEKTDEDISHRFGGNGKTFFKFPFDNPQKPAAKAYREIEEGLSSLAPETILFLKNIREVYVSFGLHESLVTKAENGNITVLQRLEDSGKSIESHYYLKFEKTIDKFTLEDGSNPGLLTIGIAYRLRQKEGLREPVPGRPSERYAIVPMTNRNVFVFFPAEKETSGLRFCIHAPFASTAARDSVRDTSDNRKIVSLLVDLQAECLCRLKADGFLTTEFLGILPNSKDKVADMYSGFHDQAIRLFKDEPLTPTRSGVHAPATDLFKGSVALSDVISDEDLAEFQGEDSKWGKNAKMIHSHADNFLTDLEIPEYDIEQLVNDLETTDVRQVRQMMSRKTTVQLASLYSQLSEYLDSHEDVSEPLRAIPIIRLSTGEMECADAGVFMGESLQEVEKIQDCKFVDPEIYGGKRSSRQRDEILRFFRNLGIEECNEASMMKSFIDRFWKDKEKRCLSDVDCAAYLARLVKLLAAKKIASEDAKRFPVRSQRGQYIEISKAYVDEPYLETGLSCLADALASEGFHLLDSLYAKHMSKAELEKFLSVLNELGVHVRLWLIESWIYNNPHLSSLIDRSRRTSWYKRERDYDIPGLAKVRIGMREPQARLVWELLLSVKTEELTAAYSANMSDPGRKAPATYICTLTDSSWIPCKDGSRRKPCDAGFDDLPGAWTRPQQEYDHPALAAIKFGQATKLRREAQEKEDETFRRLGFSGGAEEARQVTEFLCEMRKHGMTLDQIKEKIVRQKRTETVSSRDLPKEAARNVSARMETVARNFASAPKQQYVVVGRSIHVANSRIREDARAYLRAKYEINGEMFCQLCQKATPFRARDGRGYFEATQIFARMHKDITEQFVSLCPQCRAKYDEWIRKSAERALSLKASIIEHQPKQGEESVRIPLPGESENGVKNPLTGKTLYFTGTHFVDLRQSVLEDERLGGPDDSTESENMAAAQENVMGFVDWYLSHNKTGKLALAQISHSLAKIKECRQQNRKGGVVMWETCSGRYIKEVMSFWSDYHARFPFGESEPEARLSVERRSREIA